MNHKPRLSFWQIWNMSFGFLGIQFGLALQNANVSRIFQTLGADVENIPIYWLAAPLTGLLVQPIIGHMSDRTWGRLGRRRPYFLAGAILASIALLLMPNAPALGASSSWLSALFIAIGLLWILDASINISMEPFRALVADMLPSEQRTTGFAMQSFFIGIGSVVASFLPYAFNNWFEISNTAPAGQIPQSVTLSFYIGAAVFIGAIIWTVTYTKEYSPEQIKQFSGSPIESQSTGNGLLEILRAIRQMPKAMIQLAFVQFFSWFALFALWIYTTPAVTSHIYHTNDPTSKLYNEGADWVSVLFGFYNGFAALLAFLLPVLALKTSRKTVHMISLIAGGLGLISIYLFDNPNLLIISMLGIGLAWASILSMPYAILAGSLPPAKTGTYMGIFNFFIVIPQITAGSILGFITATLFNGQAIYALVLGGVSMILAAVLVTLVQDVDDVRSQVSPEVRDTVTKDLKVQNYRK